MWFMLFHVRYTHIWPQHKDASTKSYKVAIFGIGQMLRSYIDASEKVPKNFLYKCRVCLSVCR